MLTTTLDISTQGSWKRQLTEALPSMGHRNWIVIADAAYPSQTAAGIKLSWTNEDHLVVLNEVLSQIENSPHIRPVIYLDEEIKFLHEHSAAGIHHLRGEMMNACKKYSCINLPHEEIIQKLQSAGELFKVIVFKTNLTLPYTSIFIQLECGYWSEDEENSLRAEMKNRNPNI